MRTSIGKKYYAALAICLFLVAGLAAREVVRTKNVRKMKQYISQFTPIEGLGTFEQSRPVFIRPGPKPFAYAVLLLHGYSGSTMEYKEIGEALGAAGIPCYAPRLTGFGLSDFHLLREVRPADWIRDADEAYMMLSALADEVSVVGHSTGGTLAALVAMRHDVRNLVLVGPNFFPGKADSGYKKLLRAPVLGEAVRFALPVFAKPVRPGRTMPTDTLDPVAAGSGFNYHTLPINSLLAQWDLQGLVDIEKARYERLFLLYGEKDLTVDNELTVKYLKDRGIKFESYTFPGSGHNIFQDYERDAAIDTLVKVLSEVR